jgi:DNA topoisomerase IA
MDNINNNNILSPNQVNELLDDVENKFRENENILTNKEIEKLLDDVKKENTEYKLTFQEQKDKIIQLEEELENHKNAIGILTGGLLGIKLGVNNHRINSIFENLMKQIDDILK